MWPIITLTGTGVSVFHNLMVLSADALRKKYPESLNLTDQIIFVWDLKFKSSILVLRHHNLMILSVPADNKKN